MRRGPTVAGGRSSLAGAAARTALLGACAIAIALGLAACRIAGGPRVAGSVTPTAALIPQAAALFGRQGTASDLSTGRPDSASDLSTLSLSRPVTVTLGDGRAEGRWSGAGVPEVWLVDPGRPSEAAVTGHTVARSGVWTAYFEDDAGAPVFPAPGQLLVRQDVGEPDQTRQEGATVPPVALSFDRPSGRIVGRTDPDLVVDVAIELAPDEPYLAKAFGPGAVSPAPLGIGPQVRATAAVRPDGAFELEPVAGHALLGSQAMTVTLRTRQDLRLVVHRSVPWVRVSLYPGDIVGAGAPLSPVTLVLRDGDGRWRGAGLGRADSRGQFHVWLRDEAGERVRPEPGDRLAVDAGDDAWQLVLPTLTATADSRRGRLSGHGMAASALDVIVWDPWQPGRYATQRTTVDDSRSWQADVDVAIAPGTRYCVSQRLPEGDGLFTCDQLARLFVQPGSPRVTAEALADVRADLVLTRGGRPIAHAAGSEPWSGRLTVDFVGADGALVPIQPEDDIRGTLSGSKVELTVPDFEAALSPDQRRVEGRTVPGWPITLTGSPGGLERHATAGADGRFAVALPSEEADRTCGLAPGVGLAAYVTTAGGQMVGKQFLAPRLVVDLDGASIRGEAEPRAPVSWFVAPDPAQAAPVRVSASGTVRIDLPTAAAPGTSWSLWIGACPIDIEVPALTVTYSSASGIAAGRAPTTGSLELAIYQGPRSPADALGLLAGADGRWSVDLGGTRPNTYRYDPASVRRLELAWDPGSGPSYVRTWPSGAP